MSSNRPNPSRLDVFASDEKLPVVTEIIYNRTENSFGIKLHCTTESPLLQITIGNEPVRSVYQIMIGVAGVEASKDVKTAIVKFSQIVEAKL